MTTFADVLSGAARWHIEQGDSAKVAPSIPDASIDAIVADPPAGIAFMGKAWDGDKGGKEHWIEWLAGILREAFRVLKPGGHMVLWALPRTSHWTAEAIERAGFEIRDVLVHLQGAGFPKSLSVEKAIGGEDGKAWAGWGTSLKPANERWIRAQKPIVELDDAATISARLEELEALVCSEIAKRAAQSSRPSRASSRKAKGASAPVPVATHREDGRQNGTAIGGADDSSEVTDMSRSGWAASTSSNIVPSWRRTWAAICERTSTYTTATASSLTTDLRILRSSLSQITPESIILDGLNPSGAPSLASVVGQTFDALKTACDAIQTSVAVDPASPSSCAGRVWRSLPGALVVPMALSSEDWILARKPLDGTVAASVLRHGTGALNIDAARVASAEPIAAHHGPGDGFTVGAERPYQPGDAGKVTRSDGRFPANLVLSHTAWEETHCRPCGAVLSFVARFCPECGSDAVTHRRAGCCAVGERSVSTGTTYEPTGDREGRSTPLSPAKMLGRTVGYADPDGLETVTAWECLASCDCGRSRLAASGGAAPRCACGRPMRWACPVARLDEQSGVTDSGGRAGVYGDCGIFDRESQHGKAVNPCPPDSGGASRFFNTFAPPDDVEPFFWCAKPSAAETEAGCEALPLKSAAENVDREENSAGMQSPRAGAGRLSGRRNHHPTKKSVALMRHFCRLVCPPGGIALDMFAGSGTTIGAWQLEGGRAIGIEMDPEFVAIARARAAFWGRLAGTKAATMAKPRPVREKTTTGQGTLF